MLSLGPRLSGAFAFSVPHETSVVPSKEERAINVETARVAKALLQSTRGETHPALLHVRRMASAVLRKAYSAIRVARCRQRLALMARFVAAARVEALASANWLGLSLAQRSLKLDSASLS